MMGKHETTTAHLIDSIEWPPHQVTMHVEHNLHLSYYETIETALMGGNPIYHRDDFPDEAEVAKAIETGNVWTIQWYPDTPVGFCRVSAATLSRAVQAANGQ